MAACTSCSATSRLEFQTELQRDDRTAAGTGGGHLVQSGHLPELALQRRGDGGGHDVRTGARIEGEHLNGRVIDLGQGRNRQLAIGDGPGQQNGDHQTGRSPPAAG